MHAYESDRLIMCKETVLLLCIITTQSVLVQLLSKFDKDEGISPMYNYNTVYPSPITLKM